MDPPRIRRLRHCPTTPATEDVPYVTPAHGVVACCCIYCRRCIRFCAEPQRTTTWRRRQERSAAFLVIGLRCEKCFSKLLKRAYSAFDTDVRPHTAPRRPRVILQQGEGGLEARSVRRHGGPGWAQECGAHCLTAGAWYLKSLEVCPSASELVVLGLQGAAEQAV